MQISIESTPETCCYTCPICNFSISKWGRVGGWTIEIKEPRKIYAQNWFDCFTPFAFSILLAIYSIFNRILGQCRFNHIRNIYLATKPMYMWTSMKFALWMNGRNKMIRRVVRCICVGGKATKGCQQTHASFSSVFAFDSWINVHVSLTLVGSDRNVVSFTA